MTRYDLNNWIIITGLFALWVVVMLISTGAFGWID